MHRDRYITETSENTENICVSAKFYSTIMQFIIYEKKEAFS